MPGATSPLFPVSVSYSPRTAIDRGVAVFRELRNISALFSSGISFSRARPALIRDRWTLIPAFLVMRGEPNRTVFGVPRQAYGVNFRHYDAAGSPLSATTLPPYFSVGWTNPSD